MKILIILISNLIISLDKIIQIIFGKTSLIPRIHDKIEEKQYYTRKINNKNIKFFCPSFRTLERLTTLETKEPETLHWIDNFQSTNDEIVFWDVGANIGLYSIYASIKFQNIVIYSFEPSTSNTRTLSRNIWINLLSNKINIIPIALSDKKNEISFFNQTRFIEGGAISTFGKNKDHHGKHLTPELLKNKYKLYGSNIDELLNSNDIKTPNYVKIDVDGIEHLILKGALNLLNNNQLKEILIELNPDYKDQYDMVDDILTTKGFKKISEMNSKLFFNKDHKLKENEKVNVIFQRK